MIEEDIKKILETVEANRKILGDTQEKMLATMERIVTLLEDGAGAKKTRTKKTKKEAETPKEEPAFSVDEAFEWAKGLVEEGKTTPTVIGEILQTFGVNKVKELPDDKTAVEFKKMLEGEIAKTGRRKMTTRSDNSGVHSEFGGSTAARWLACPGSIPLARRMPRLPAGDFANEGSLAHEIARLALEEYGVSLLDTPDNEMISCAIRYSHYVRGELSGAVVSEFGKIHIEKKVDYSHLVPGGFGTVDAYAVSKDGERCQMFDYKYGRGVEVAAEENRQLMTYACGIEKENPGIKFWTVHIFQPRVGNVKKWSFDVTRLRAHKLEMIRAAKSAASSRPGFSPALETCRFCPAITICDALKNEVEVLAELTPKNEMPEINEDTLKLLKNRDLVKNYLYKLERHAVSLLSMGMNIPGFALEPGRSITRLTVEGEEKLKEKFGGDVMRTEVKMKTLTDIRTMLKDEPEFLNGLTFKPAGEPKLVSTEETEI